MTLGPPKRDTAPPAEKWVPCDTPHMYRDAPRVLPAHKGHEHVDAGGYGRLDRETESLAESTIARSIPGAKAVFLAASDR